MSQPQRPRALSAADKLDWLRLIRSEPVGPVTFARLIERFGTAASARSALPELARRGGRAEALRICDQATATREIEGLEKLGSRLVALGEEDYPPALAALDDAPPLLSVLGRADVLKKPMIAVVGARNARPTAGDLRSRCRAISAKRDSSSLPAWPVESTPRPMKARWRREPSLPAGSM